MKVEGRNAVLELLKTEKTVDKLLMQRGAEKSAGRIFAMAREKNIRVQFADVRALDRESETGRHQGVIAYVSDYEYADLADLCAPKNGARFVVVCDGVEDVHNLGSILRVAECAGADGVVIPKNKSAQVTGAVVRISEGAANHIKVARVPGVNYAIDELKKAGYWVYGLEADGEDIYSCDLTGDIALVVGGEDSGIGALTRKKCDKILSLPLCGKVNSLNASVALGAAAYEAVRQRR
ncbi:MAG TPA: 23S rRNA (guanosine(2251)-2'-O)-methyltransferase RlmB [Candidatus Borkfalkia excrementigallinarum]|uniref:23S rRNA (Guanosine(2251)-2'-O)-methyltransferase RlmB n=1 Tax=Candidatus Borkfalkia excrementigallinarum TaxID=2838506 RepID=A0A9D2CT47_9FIRM|nr:23S rRNA (guanosine(2251)-2'-O)-methyltransferase RlmB [Candidatus Borkfalkia excrementigallinarum]